MTLYKLRYVQHNIEQGLKVQLLKSRNLLVNHILYKQVNPHGTRPIYI